MTTPSPLVDYDRNPELVDVFEQGARWFIPGYDLSHALASVLLHDAIGATGQILVIGAGGGLEIAALAQGSEWRFSGVDISAQMLDKARRRLDGLNLSARVELVLGSIDALPAIASFDAATAFLVLHFIADDGARLAALKAIRARLRPGAPFVMITGCSDMRSADFERDLRLGAAAAIRNGAPPAMAEQWMAMQREGVLGLVSVARETELLAEAGFGDARHFYRGLMVVGWIATA